MGGRARRVPGRARCAADVARERVDVRSRGRRRTSDARRYAPLDGSGEPRSIDCAGKRTSTSSRPRRPRQETMILNRLLAMNNSLSTQSALPKAPRRARWAPVLLALVAIVAALFVASCKKGGAGAKPADVDYYTCTMHPSVKKLSPTDKCPICSMDLTPVFKKSPAAHDHSGHTAATNQPTETNSVAPSAAAPEDKPTEFTVSVERQQQIGVTYAAVE